MVDSINSQVPNEVFENGLNGGHITDIYKQKKAIEVAIGTPADTAKPLIKLTENIEANTDTPASIYQKRVTVNHETGSAVDSARALKCGVTIKAPSTNTGIVYVGGSSSVSTTGATIGYPLSADDSTPFLSVDDISSIFAIASASSNSIDIMGS